MPAAGELELTSLLEAYINANRDMDKYPQPIWLARPWGSSAAEEQVTKEERAALEARLLKTSAMRNL